MLDLSFRTHLYLGLALRAVLIYYGDHVDRSSPTVKFTDVDYHVFTDAARHVWYGESPYLRHTYRYTPVLAWMLTPNITLTPLFGKILFCLFDIFSTVLIYGLVRRYYGSDGASAEQSAALNAQAKISALFWLYNPLVFAVSARGNADTVIVSLVLVTLYLFQLRVYVLAGFAFGLAIHFKLYPVIYGLSFVLALSNKQGWRNLFHINLARFRFAIGLISSLGVITALCCHYYGMPFLEEAYLYHLGRRDIRHNFSVYFYMLYLTVDDDDVGINALAFLPQIILIAAVAKQFSSRADLPFCLFCQTVVFVTYNKVCTSQYFLWYLCLLPLCLPRLRFTRNEAVLCFVLWMVTQGSWLVPAYCLEFNGSNCFQAIWMEGLAFFMANVGLLSKFIRKYREVQEDVDVIKELNQVD